ncbi:hypothetical protein CVS40_0906 [Lucilia cuprina]|nr:hypothetical protein CVS40_0906 [Lucilia cuprina]
MYIPLRFEDFYSHSFVPDALKIDYEIQNDISLYYNVTAFRPFPGKLLMNFFVRKFNRIKGRPSLNIRKQRNIDFCKTLDVLKNITRDSISGTSFIQDTFISSCPLTNGFYYIQNGTISSNVIPNIVDDGRYLMHLELIQIVNEVIKLMNFRFVLVVDKNNEGINFNQVFKNQG